MSTVAIIDLLIKREIPNVNFTGGFIFYKEKFQSVNFTGGFVLLYSSED